MTPTMTRSRSLDWAALVLLAVLVALYVVPAWATTRPLSVATVAAPAPAKLYSVPALSRANDACQAVSDDLGYELCVIGAYALDRRVAILTDDYSVNYRGRVVFTPSALAKVK